MRGGRERRKEGGGWGKLPTGTVHISETTATKFRSCSIHRKSFSVFKSHFLSQTFTPSAVAKRKRPTTREVSGMHPREPQLSCRAAIVLQWSSKKKTVQGEAGGEQGERGGPRREQSPTHGCPRATGDHHASGPLKSPAERGDQMRGKQGKGRRKWKRKGSCLEGSRLCIDKAQWGFGTRPGVRGWDIYVSPSWLKESWGVGRWRRLGKKEKENKLCSPLNIHDSSFAEANGKHINPFTTLLNAKKMDEGHSMLWGKLGGIWKSGPQAVGISGREERAGSRFYLAHSSRYGDQSPFICNDYNKTRLESGFSITPHFSRTFFSPKSFSFFFFFFFSPPQH